MIEDIMYKAYLKLMDMYQHNINNKYGIDYLFDIESDQYFYGDCYAKARF